jgi:cytochrome b6-f complex iron-sulfur subunit
MKPVKDCSGCSRRSVLQGLGVTAIGALVLGGCQTSGTTLSTATSSTCGGNTCIDTSNASNSALASAGGAMIVDMGADSVAVIRKSATEVVALSAICTHAGCEMDYDEPNQRMDCGCHGSQFALDGSVIQGPAQRPVKIYQASVNGNVITVVP